MKSGKQAASAMDQRRAPGLTTKEVLCAGRDSGRDQRRGPGRGVPADLQDGHQASRAVRRDEKEMQEEGPHGRISKIAHVSSMKSERRRNWERA